MFVRLAMSIWSLSQMSLRSSMAKLAWRECDTVFYSYLLLFRMTTPSGKTDRSGYLYFGVILSQRNL